MPLAKDPVEVLQVKKLLHCVRTQDYSQIRKLCEKGVQLLINFNEPYDGLTALILAAVQNNEKMMEFLLELGAHPNVADLKVGNLLLLFCQ
jgi:ankyrin repeat protein